MADTSKRSHPQPRIVTRWRWSQGHWSTEDGPITQEAPLTLFVNGEELVTLVMTPSYLEDLVIGFLAAKGLIRQTSDIAQMKWVPGDDQVWVEIPGIPPDRPAPLRQLSIRRADGRPGFYRAADGIGSPVSPAGPPLSVSAIQTLMAELTTRRLTEPTGGVHSAALAERDRILIWRTDVGRHNALDKVWGAVLRAEATAAGHTVIFSGRISSEILLKVAAMGCGAIISNAAPTTLAIDLADALNITTVGFVRPGELSVYTHPERVAIDAGQDPG